jgi:hypothetical protein
MGYWLMMRALASCVLACVLLGACGGDDTGADAMPPVADAGPDPTIPLFDKDHVVEVDIELAPGDWDALRAQTRRLFDVLAGADCLDAPFGSPFTPFRGTVTIDGTRLENVGVRKKGFIGSLSATRPSLKLKLDEYVDGQRYLTMSRLTLNNVRQDPSLVRTCLAYAMFADAGSPAPRCNFAHVTVNGEDMGVYVHVESVDKRFLRAHFATDQGNLYEGTLSDFRPEYQHTFEAKTNEATADGSDLAVLTDALASASDAELEGALAATIDVDEFLSFWALEVLMGHWDGYSGNTNNFFVYHDPSDGRLHFLPWGADAVLEPGLDFGAPGGPAITAVAADGLLARRLYAIPATRASYVARLTELLDGVFDEDHLLAEVDRMEALLGGVVAPEDLAAWGAALDEVRGVIMSRRAELLAELDPAAPPWAEPLRPPLCFPILGNVSGSISTTWGTAGAQDPWMTGSGSLTVVQGGVGGALMPVGGTAGDEQNPPAGQAPARTITWVAPNGDGTYAVAFVVVQPWAFFPGTQYVDLFGPVQALLFRFDPAGGGSFTPVGRLAGGELTLTATGTTNGAPVAASFELTLVEL